MDLKECLVQEHTVDWGNSLGAKIVYIKTPMLFEDFGEEEKAMLLTTNYIRDHTALTVHKDNNAMVYRLKAAFQVSKTEPKLKVSALVQMINPSVDSRQIQDTKEKLADVLIHKVKTYYGVQEYKEKKNMPIYMNNYDLPDELKKMFGIQKRTPDNKPKWLEGILPAVEKVDAYNKRVVKVTFIDGTYTKAVCSENDNFDLDVGITICAMKRLLGTNSDNATREYNRFIDHVHSVMKKNALEDVAEEARKAKEKSKKRKAELKRAARKLKAREEQIDIQKQAILRAQKELEAEDQ